MEIAEDDKGRMEKQRLGLALEGGQREKKVWVHPCLWCGRFGRSRSNDKKTHCFIHDIKPGAHKL